MPAPHVVSTLRSFLGSVQFYAEFLLPSFVSVAEPLSRLIRKGHRWAWGSEEEAGFRRLKELLSAADVFAHFDPSLPLGVACDASAVGIGATLFHRYSDGSERPIATSPATTRQPPTSENVSPDYGPSHSRRSKRPRKPRNIFVDKVTISLPHRGGVRVVRITSIIH